MKQPDAIEVIEFPSGHTMEHSNKLFVAFAIAFFASLSSAAYIKEDFNLAAKNIEKNINFEPRTLREKRHQDEHFDIFVEDDAVNADDRLSEFPEKRAITEEITETKVKYENNEEQEKQSAQVSI